MREREGESVGFLYIHHATGQWSDVMYTSIFFFILKKKKKKNQYTPISSSIHPRTIDYQPSSKKYIYRVWEKFKGNESSRRGIGIYTLSSSSSSSSFARAAQQTTRSIGQSSAPESCYRNTNSSSAREKDRAKSAVQYIYGVGGKEKIARVKKKACGDRERWGGREDSTGGEMKKKRININSFLPPARARTLQLPTVRERLVGVCVYICRSINRERFYTGIFSTVCVWTFL